MFWYSLLIAFSVLSSESYGAEGNCPVEIKSGYLPTPDGEDGALFSYVSFDAEELDVSYTRSRDESGRHDLVFELSHQENILVAGRLLSPLSGMEAAFKFGIASSDGDVEFWIYEDIDMDSRLDLVGSTGERQERFIRLRDDWEAVSSLSDGLATTTNGRRLAYNFEESKWTNCEGNVEVPESRPGVALADFTPGQVRCRAASGDTASSCVAIDIEAGELDSASITMCTDETSMRTVRLIIGATPYIGLLIRLGSQDEIERVELTITPQNSSKRIVYGDMDGDGFLESASEVPN